MKIQQRPGFAPGIAPHFARRRTSSGCMRKRAAASASESVRKGAATAARSVDAGLVMFDSRWFAALFFDSKEAVLIRSVAFTRMG